MTEKSVPGVPPFMHVMARCDRLRTYLEWLQEDGMRDDQPRKVKSWWGPLVHDRNMGMGDDRIRSDRCPVDIAEALETARCIHALPDTLRGAILEEHVIGGTQAEKCEQLEIERTTLWRRRQAAYHRLLVMFHLEAAGLPVNEDEDAVP